MTTETIAATIIVGSGGASAACLGMAVREGKRLIGEQLRRSFGEPKPAPATLQQLVDELHAI